MEVEAFKNIQPMEEEKAGHVVLLGTWASAYCTTVKLALKLKGIPYKYVEEDLANKSHLLLQNNPVHAKVPVLLHNGSPIAESLVILEYIDETWNHGPKLMPHDPYQRAKVRFWVNYYDQNFMHCNVLILQSKGEERKKAIQNMNEIIKVFEEGIKKDFAEEFSFSEGKSLGMLDIVVGSSSCNYRALNEAIEAEVIGPTKNPEFFSWVNALREHPLMKETLPPHDNLVAKLIERFGRPN